MLNYKLLALLLIFSSTAQANPLSSGQLLNENKDNFEMPRQSNASVFEETQKENESTNDEKVFVKGFKISGQDIFKEEELLKLLNNKNQLLSFKDLENNAYVISNYFEKHGYVVRTFMPEQKIEDGIVEYRVIVGIVGDVSIVNNTSIHNKALQREAASLKTGRYLKKDDLQRAVWLVSDLAGTDAKAILSPNSENGKINIEITANKHKGKQGLLTLSNYENRYVGYGKADLYYDFFNLAKEGDILSTSVTYTQENMLNYGISYKIPVANGLKLTLGYNDLRYHLGKEYDILDAYGRANVSSIALDYAIKRSQKHNLYAGIRYEYTDLKDEYEALDLEYNDKHSNALILSLYGNEIDRKGATYWRVENKFGNISFDSDETRYFYSDSGTEGSFFKTKIDIIRRQDLNRRLYLLLSGRGQYSSKNLDSSEHMSLGGFSGVRAYPQSEASGDCGYLLRAELRWLMPLKSDHQLQLAYYVDHGGILVNRDGNMPNNYRHLEGMGIGIIYSRYEDWFIRMDYAWRLGHERPTSDTHRNNGCFWIRGGIYF